MRQCVHLFFLPSENTLHFSRDLFLSSSDYFFFNDFVWMNFYIRNIRFGRKKNHFICYTYMWQPNYSILYEIISNFKFFYAGDKMNIKVSMNFKRFFPMYALRWNTITNIICNWMYLLANESNHDATLNCINKIRSFLGQNQIKFRSWNRNQRMCLAGPSW